MAIHFFFFNDTATTEIYTLSLHDALPISSACRAGPALRRELHALRLAVLGLHIIGPVPGTALGHDPLRGARRAVRSEEHTSELQSRLHLVCRLLLEKKKPSACHKRSYPRN